MPLTNATLVEGVLQGDYDGSTDLTQYLAAASMLLDNAAASAFASKGLVYTDAQRTVLETWVAAHYYAVSDKPYAQRSTAGASGSFQGQTAMYLEATLYGQTAMRLDPTGALDTVGGAVKHKARIMWLGKHSHDQRHSCG